MLELSRFLLCSFSRVPHITTQRGGGRTRAFKETIKNGGGLFCGCGDIAVRLWGISRIFMSSGWDRIQSTSSLHPCTRLATYIRQTLATLQ